MNDRTRRVVEAFWTHDLGAESGFATLPVSCTVQRLYNGVQIFRRDGAIVIAAPPEKHQYIRDSLSGLSSEELFSVDWLQRVLGPDLEKIRGPAELFYADETSFRPAAKMEARTLSDSDLPGYRILEGALDPKESQDSGFSSAKFPAFGAFSEDMLCAAASYTVWEPSIAHITVATHPEHRRRGFAKAAVSALAEDALGRGLILQWQTVVWNTNSLALARDLGFEHYCSKIFARCRRASE
jgi:GNAT superfamily N-acetyltransferase